MPHRTVSIFELVKQKGKRSWQAVEIPERQKPLGGGLYLKDDRHGEFYISWYSDELDSKGRPRKRFKKVKGGRLGLAIVAREAKKWEVRHPERVKQEIPDDERLTIGGGIYRYLDQMAGDDYTKKEHRHALEQYQKWTGNTVIDQMTRDEVLRFKAYCEKTKQNDELTAVWKLIRINKFYKWALKKGPGEGLIKTTEFKRVLQRKPKVEVYTKHELEKFFAACNEKQGALFQLYYKCRLRNKELAHLEWADINLERREVDIHQGRRSVCRC